MNLTGDIKLTNNDNSNKCLISLVSGKPIKPYVNLLTLN